MGKNADGSPLGLSQGIPQHSPVLILGVLQGPAGAKNGHDRNPLAKVCPIAHTKLTSGSAFWGGCWSEFLYGLFGP